METQTEKFLDVTQLPPREKHPTIFRYFDDLKEGESFVIHNDHDPKPLYYQLLGERGKIFSWDYIKQGPDVFEIRIAKLVNDNADANEETVGEICAKDYRKAEVFKKLGVDFCCHGDKSIKEASVEAGVSEVELRNQLAEAEKAPMSGPQFDYSKWDLDFLADFIKQMHHRYVRENADVITGLADKIASVHGGHHPELIEMMPRVHHMIEDFLQHMDKEEKLIFPAIKELVNHKKNGTRPTGAPDAVHKLIHEAEAEHDETGEALRYFNELTKNYEIPSDACNSYRYYFQKMKEFEEDTFRHVHLENNILFPKAVTLERKLNA